MAKWGSADFEQFKQLQERLERLERIDLDTFCRDASKELAARLLALVIPRTPVGVKPELPEVSASKGGDKPYPNPQEYWEGYVGGTLRRGWTANTQAEAEAGSGSPNAAQAKQYAQSLPIAKAGNSYTVTVINPVEYASYVEFGHRQTPGRYVPALGKQLKESATKGKFFLTESEEKLRTMAPRILQQKLEAFLREVFSGG